MIERTLKKGKELIYLSTQLTTYTLFAEDFALEDDPVTNTITISFDLNCNYRTRNKGEHTYLDVQEVDGDFAAITLVEINNEQVTENLVRYVQNRGKKFEKMRLKLIAKNQSIREIDFEESDGLRMRLI